MSGWNIKQPGWVSWNHSEVCFSIKQSGFTREEIGEEDNPSTNRYQKRSICQVRGRDILRFTVVAQFLDEWNWEGILPELRIETVYNLSDTSDLWGCAAVWDMRWLQWPWNKHSQEYRFKGAISNYVSRHGLGKGCRSMKACCHSGNKSVVKVLNNVCSRDATLMHLPRFLFFISENYQFLVEAVYIPEKENILCNCTSIIQMVLRTKQQPVGTY